MAVDEKNEGTGDPLRDLLIAQGKAEQEARDALYEASLAQGRELLAAQLAQTRQPIWQPPTEEAFNHEWVRPKVAWEQLHVIISGESDRERYIMDRLKSGLILAVARDAEARAKGEARARRDRFALIPQHYWDLCGTWGDDHFWRSGDNTFEFSDLVVHRCLDIRFPPDWYEGSPSIERPQEGVPVSLPQPQNKGGAPRKGWWDDLWIEMIRRIRADELHPQSGADLRRIMEEWLGQQGIYPGDETLKKTALKLFKYLKE